MNERSDIYNKWTSSGQPDQGHVESLDNGCQMEVRVREIPGDCIALLVCVYDHDGHTVVERVEKLPTSEWTLADALKRGRDQAERIAGGEAGRLRCADSGQTAMD